MTTPNYSGGLDTSQPVVFPAGVVAPLVSTSHVANYAVQTSDSGSLMAANQSSATTVFTLPPAGTNSGLVFTFVNNVLSNATGLQLVCSGTDVITLYGQATSSPSTGSVTSTAARQSITVACLGGSNGHWYQIAGDAPANWTVV
jgi:hypothetical protein